MVLILLHMTTAAAAPAADTPGGVVGMAPFGRMGGR